MAQQNQIRILSVVGSLYALRAMWAGSIGLPELLSPAKPSVSIGLVTVHLIYIPDVLSKDFNSKGLI